jgi:outer membrane protein assembly factor BamC
MMRQFWTFRLNRGACALLAAAMLAGCSWTSTLFKGDTIDYKSQGQAQAAPTLEVPPDLTAPTRDDRYAIPGDGAARRVATASGEATRAGTRPVAAGVLPAIKDARIERAGTQRWMVVSAKPEQIWQTVKEFWQENGFVIEIERPESGVMETDWAENRAKIGQDIIRRTVGRFLDALYSTPERDKFRTRLETSTTGDTEIYISHRGMIEIYKTEGRDETVWQPRPADPELEADFLRRLMVRLGTDEARAKQVLAIGDRPAERAKIIRTGTDSLVELDDSFDRAWRRVGLALDRVGFTVEDRDRSKGLYFVRYADPDAGQKKPDTGIMSRVTNIFRSEPVKTAEQYQVQVRDARTATQVAVLSKTGATENSVTTQRILGLLHEQLK